ncbi:MAG: tetratricopeptide repeat protein [Candidatus Muiribacteriota bacterium]
MKKFFVILTLFIIIQSVICSQITSDWVEFSGDAHELYLRAETLYKNGFLNEAKDLLIKVIEIDRDFIGAYYLIGKIYKDNNDYAEAMKYFERAITIRQDREKREKAIIEASQPPDIGGKIKTVLELQKEAETVMNQAMLFLEEGDFAGAENYIKYAIELNPNVAEYYFRLADIYLDKNLPEDANLNIRKGLRLEPENVNRQIMLAKLFAGDGEFESAVRTLRTAMDAAKFNSDEMRNLLAEYSGKISNLAKIMIIKREGREVIFNAGFRDGVKRGMEFRSHFTVYRGGAQVKDIATGEYLGITDEEAVGEILVTKVEDKLTYGQITRETAARIRIGDYIKQ